MPLVLTVEITPMSFCLNLVVIFVVCELNECQNENHVLKLK